MYINCINISEALSLCVPLWHPDWMLEYYIDFALQLSGFAFTTDTAFPQ